MIPHGYGVIRHGYGVVPRGYGVVRHGYGVVPRGYGVEILKKTGAPSAMTFCTIRLETLNFYFLAHFSKHSVQDFCLQTPWNLEIQDITIQGVQLSERRFVLDGK